MAKYVVTIEEVHSYDIEVEAENEKEARNKACDRIEEGEFEATYSYTFDPQEWNVSEK